MQPYWSLNRALSVSCCSGSSCGIGMAFSMCVCVCVCVCVRACM
jgi:hypothetical protein